MAVHDSIDPFVDFMLLAQEADDMQLFDNPAYRKKLDVFLKVRSLMQLKAEEIDAKKVIPPREELWQAYLKEYTPILNLRMIAVQEEGQCKQSEDCRRNCRPHGERTPCSAANQHHKKKGRQNRCLVFCERSD